LKKVGLLGGSFDPPHRGHLYISLEAKKILSLDEVWWLVTPQNPLKIIKPATYKERIKNCKKLSISNPIIIKEIEKDIKSSNTFQTINYLQNHYKNIIFFWLMGADNLINFHKWQNWKSIFNNIPVVVFKRHGYNTSALKSISSNTFKKFRIQNRNLKKISFKSLPKWVWVENKEIKISSTEIRNQREILRGKN